MKLPISLVAIVHNAEKELQTFIERHRDIVSEVIIVDQGSTDKTYALAVQHADRVFKRRCKGASDPDRNWAFALASQEYVLYLDADEHLPDETKAILPDILKTRADAFWFKRKNFVDGIDLSKTLGDDPQCRLFRPGAVRWADTIHTHPEPVVGIKVFFLEACMHHERTLEGLKKAQRDREQIATPKQKELQDNFVKIVENAMVSGLRPSR